jgi:hypothetical protein
MTLYTIFLFIHLTNVTYFAGFIFLDRVLFRKFFIYQNDKITFYKMAQKSLYISAILITISGLYLVSQYHTLSLLILAKIVLAFLLFYLFFSCPKWQQKISKRVGNYYRYTVVLLLVVLLFIALLL